MISCLSALLTILPAGVPALPAPILHLRADTGLVLDADGRVATWKDLSPRHSDFVTPDLPNPSLIFLAGFSGDLPQWRSATLGSAAALRPTPEAKCRLGTGACVRFNGANSLVDTTSLPLDSGFTLFVVAQDSSGKNAYTALVDKGPGDMNTDLWTGIDGNFQMGCAWVKNVAKSDLETAKPTLYGSSWDGFRGNLWADGNPEGSGTWSGKPVRNKRTWLGSVYNQYSELMGFLTGRIYEVRIYPGVLCDTARRTIEDSLMCRYSVKPAPRSKDRRILHLRADTGLVLDAAGRVATWKDLSPRHSDFVTPAMARPELLFLTPYVDDRAGRKTRILDSAALLRPAPEKECKLGKGACVRFDGANALTDTTSLPLDSGFTLFIVAQDSSGPGAFTALLDKGPGDMNTDLWTGVDGNFQMGCAWVKNVAKSNLETAKPTVYGSSWDGFRGTIWADGRLEGAGTWDGMPSRNKNTWLGAVYNQYPVLMGFLTGRIYEVRVYSGVLDSTSRKAIEDSLKAKYGIQPLPPAPDRRILHLRADTGLVLDGDGRVAIWKDLSPRHSDFVTPRLGKPELLFLTRYADTAAKRRYVTLAADSLLRPHPETRCLVGVGSCVRFDGANTLVDTTSLPLDSGFTLFLVAQDSSGPGAFTALLDKGPGDMNTDLWTGVDGNFQMGVGWVRNIAKSNLETSLPTVYSSMWNGSRGSIWANGRLEGTGLWDGRVTRNKSTWLGATYNQYPVLMGFLTGRIYEVLAYAGSMDSAERVAMERSLVLQYRVFEPAPAKVLPAAKAAAYHRRLAGNAIEISGAGEGRAMLLGMDGRILSSANVREGKASLPLPRGSSVLIVRTSSGVFSELIAAP